MTRFLATAALIIIAVGGYVIAGASLALLALVGALWLALTWHRPVKRKWIPPQGLA